MKSRRRHELQHNLLDTELGKLIAFLRRNATRITWVVLGVAVVVLLIVLVAVPLQRAGYERQRAFFQQDAPLAAEGDWAQQAQGFENLASGSDRWAALAAVGAGAAYANELAAQWYTLQPAERDDLAARARKWYEQVISKHASQTAAVARARFGLGKLAESLGQVDQAERHYQDVVRVAGSLTGDPIVDLARMALQQSEQLTQPARMATTRPVVIETAPAAATQPGTEAAGTAPAEPEATTSTAPAAP